MPVFDDEETRRGQREKLKAEWSVCADELVL